MVHLHSWDSPVSACEAINPPRTLPVPPSLDCWLSSPQLTTLHPPAGPCCVVPGSHRTEAGGLPVSFFPLRSGVTNTPRGGVVNCAQVTFLGILFRSQRTPSAGIVVLSSSLSVAPLSS